MATKRPAAKKTASAKKAPAKKTGARRAPAKATVTAESARSLGRAATYTVPGLSDKDGSRTAEILQSRLVSLIDLSLTLKHVHWNVVGGGFIGVHEMLDPQYQAVALMVDATAERIATLGESPNGLAGELVRQRGWDDYALGRDVVVAHLKALDSAYVGVVTSHREAVEELGDLDPVSEDLLIGQLGQLEMFQWFIRAHLESPDGYIATR
ncbi:MAG: DNA starvation/stationary phase protection protein [Actinobacteria bacterium]|nr:DNA starvation/stationary phase protection protein [Actinomycetota bacterium]